MYISFKWACKAPMMVDMATFEVQTEVAPGVAHPALRRHFYKTIPHPFSYSRLHRAIAFVSLRIWPLAGSVSSE